MKHTNTYRTSRGRAVALLGAALFAGAVCLSAGCGRHEMTASNYYSGPMVKKDQSNRANLVSGRRTSS